MIRWLHISDLHFNEDNTSADMSTTMLREELPNFISSNNLTFDYIFCTGDIRTAPSAFPDSAAEYLQLLCKTSNTKISNLFIVPGNHDVNRNVTGRDEAIRRVSYYGSDNDGKCGYYDPKYGGIQSSDLKSIHSGLDDFIAFLSIVYKDIPDRVKLYTDPEHPHFNIETDLFNVFHVDTTLVYTAGQEHHDLIIGTKPLQNALSTLNSSKPTILLTHFPFTALLQEEQKYVKELLYRKGVRLWLCGHEHDHILQPHGYLDSIQAGELRMEDRTSASVLIGEFDPSTLTGRITAYAWFPEGWAKYPIINHDNVKEDEYSFRLRLPEDNGRSREVIKAEQANKEFIDRLPDIVIPELLPEIEFRDFAGLGQGSSSRGIEDQDKIEAPEETHTTSNLKDELVKSWNTYAPNIILLADGGMGKTTILLNTCREMTVPTLYIPIERLEAIGVGIKEYCSKVFFDGDTNAFEAFSIKKFTSPSLILFIDGLNEVNPSTERKVINELKNLKLLKGIQIVVSSRSDFTTRFSMMGYRVGRFKPLSDDRIKELFTSSEWSYIKDTVTLHRLLSNPMMVTMYKEVSPIIDRYRDTEFLDWSVPVTCSTDLLKDYYISQIAVVVGRSGTDGEDVISTFQAVFSTLPAIGYAFESNHILNIKVDDFRRLMTEVLDKYRENQRNQEHEDHDFKLRAIEEHFRCFEEQELKAGFVIDLLTNVFHLLYQDNELVSFPHQIYRDFLSAEWIVRETRKCEDTIYGLWNSRGIPFPVMEHIRNLSGEYWEDGGLARIIHSAGKGIDAFNLVGNLLDCFPMTESSGVADYSGLDLRGLRIPDVKVFKALPDEKSLKSGVESTTTLISLKNTKIDNISIGKFGSQPHTFSLLRFSDDNCYLAGVSDYRIVIYTLGEDTSPFIYHAGNVMRLVFAGRYLFASVQEFSRPHVCVFTLGEDGRWSFVGDIQGTDRWNIFNNRLHFIVLSNDDVLHFYYNNREQAYRLTDCVRIRNKQITHAWENPVDGIRINGLAPYGKQSRINRENRISGYVEESNNQRKQNRANGITVICEHSGLKATAYLDGRLIVTSGREIQYVLERGITLLEDGSISGDGSKAATLSYDKFNGKRRVQLWDLNNKVRVGELYCSGDIDKIHMSENGDWIFGENANNTCVINVETGHEQWFNEHFISNQRGKLTSYGDKVLRKDGSNLLYLYDLRAGSKSELENPCKNARIACFMPDGSIAAVGNNAFKVRFRNSRTGEYSDIDTKGQPVIGLQGLKGKPFIAVATNDGVISIYHTGTCQRSKIIDTGAGNYMMVVHPEYNVVANSGGRTSFETNNYFEYKANGQDRGRWYPNPYGEDNDDPALAGDVLDLAFNTSIHELAVILSNGQIIFCHEKYCRYHGKIDIITSFNVDAYDFRGCIADDDIKEELKENGAVV